LVRDDNVITLAAERLPDKTLTLAVRVHIGGIEERYALLNRIPQHSNQFCTRTHPRRHSRSVHSQCRFRKLKAPCYQKVDIACLRPTSRLNVPCWRSEASLSAARAAKAMRSASDSFRPAVVKQLASTTVVFRTLVQSIPPVERSESRRGVHADGATIMRRRTGDQPFEATVQAGGNARAGEDCQQSLVT